MPSLATIEVGPLYPPNGLHAGEACGRIDRRVRRYLIS